MKVFKLVLWLLFLAVCWGMGSVGLFVFFAVLISRWGLAKRRGTPWKSPFGTSIRLYRGSLRRDSPQQGNLSQNARDAKVTQWDAWWAKRESGDA